MTAINMSHSLSERVLLNRAPVPIKQLTQLLRPAKIRTPKHHMADNLVDHHGVPRHVRMMSGLGGG